MSKEGFINIISDGDFKQVKTAICDSWEQGDFKSTIPYLDTINFEKKADLLEKVERLFLSLRLAIPLPTEDSMRLDIKRLSPTRELIFAALLYDDPDYEEELRKSGYLSGEEIADVCFLIDTNKWYFASKEDEKVTFLMLMNRCKSPQKLREVLFIGNEEVKYTFAKYTTETKNFDFYSYELPISENEIIEILNISPMEVKDYLSRLWEYVFKNPKKKDKESLCDYLKNLI